MVRSISATALKTALRDGAEIALLDAREEVPFDARHILMAACVPLSRLELLVDALIPRRTTRVVWCDDGEGLATAAAERMATLGWTDVAALEGGVGAWAAAGFRVYSGVHVPSKAFAEVVEHDCETPWITAETLQDLIQSKADYALFDSRSFEEFHNNSIPTAISVPGAELVYRFDDLVRSTETLVVVNCGGRTRSIIGAQALINAGVPNRVVSLQNGTQAWHLAGFQVLKGETARMPPVSATGHAAARRRAKSVAERFGVKVIDRATLDAWRAEADRRTLYVFDVRDPGEYAAGHIPGMKNVAGGQLVQETDRHAATWGARIVVVDDDGTRAIITAHWLLQMGWDAAAMTVDMGALVTESGAWAPRVLGSADRAVGIDPASLQARMEAGRTVVVDLDWHRDYRAGHIPGAWYGIRSRLDIVLAALPAADLIVFTSADGILAGLAAADWAGRARVAALEGGTRAWAEAGLPMEAGDGRLATPADDTRLRARDMPGRIEDHMRAYLSWEIDLAEQMASDDDQRFRIQRA